MDHGLIPRGAVLLVQTQEIAGVVGAGVQAGGVEQHEREQGVGARLLCSGMLCDQGDEPDGFLAKFLAHEALAHGGFVAFVEKQVERVQHAIEPGRKLGGIRHGKRQREFADALPGAHQALGDRCFAGEKGGGDFRGAEPAQRAQRERDLRFGGEFGMKADEHHPQRVVSESLVRHVFRRSMPATARVRRRCRPVFRSIVVHVAAH